MAARGLAKAESSNGACYISNAAVKLADVRRYETVASTLRGGAAAKIKRRTAASLAGWRKCGRNNIVKAWLTSRHQRRLRGLAMAYAASSA